jgi:hypothetical protein
MLNTTTSGGDGFGITIDNGNGYIDIRTSGGGGFVYYSPGPVTFNTWYHIAIVRNGSTTTTVYLNGQAQGSSFNLPVTSSTSLQLGVSTYSQDKFNGYITGFRYVKGTAVYTSNFTVPISPLTNITGTQLLLNENYNDTFLKDSSSTTPALTITNNGATRSDFTPFKYANVGRIAATGPTGPSQWGNGAGYIYYNGNVVVNRTTAATPPYTLDVAGTLNVGTDLYALSGVSYLQHLSNKLQAVSFATFSTGIRVDARNGSCIQITGFPFGTTTWGFVISYMPLTPGYCYNFKVIHKITSSTNYSMGGSIVVYPGDPNDGGFITFSAGYSANGSTTAQGQGWFFNINLFYTSAGVATASVNKFAC